jgi:hypothetical protein
MKEITGGRTGEERIGKEKEEVNGRSSSQTARALKLISSSTMSSRTRESCRELPLGLEKLILI